MKHLEQADADKKQIQNLQHLVRQSLACHRKIVHVKEYDAVRKEYDQLVANVRELIRIATDSMSESNSIADIEFSVKARIRDKYEKLGDG